MIGTVEAPLSGGFNHTAGFYRSEDELVSAVTAFLADELDRKGAIVVIGTPAHRTAFRSALFARGFPIDELTGLGRYQSLDARGLLGEILDGDRFDTIAFESTVGAMLAAANRISSSLRVYGEMVGLLWGAGRVVPAIELETMWNEVANHHEFSLFCGYAMDSIELSKNLTATKQICDLHSHLIPPAYRPAGSSRYESKQPQEFVQMFVATPSAVRRARAFVTGALDLWGLDALKYDAMIVISELATNAVVHARSPFEVRVEDRGAVVRVAVRDACAARPGNPTPSTDRPGGRGLALVAALSRSWGTSDDADGKTIWADIANST